MTSAKDKSVKRLSSLFNLTEGGREPRVKISPFEPNTRFSRSASPSADRQAQQSPLPGPNKLLSPHRPVPFLSEPGSFVSESGSNSLAPPRPSSSHSNFRTSSPPQSRPTSRAGLEPGIAPHSSGPQSSLQVDSGSTGDAKQSKRRSWLPGILRSESPEHGSHAPEAFLIGHEGKIPYDLSNLTGAQKVPELWDEEGDTLIYLFPRTAGKGPSFKVESFAYSSSRLLMSMVDGATFDDYSPNSQGGRKRQSLEPGTQSHGPVSPPMTPDMDPLDRTSSRGSRHLSDTLDSPQVEKHLYFPIALSTDGQLPSPASADGKLNAEDIETLVSARNLFAFLVGQSLVATNKNPSVFSIFLRVASLLQHYEFTNLDGSTFGETASSSFDDYIEELSLANIGHSREKTIEAIVLGERMRSLKLYNEAFVHGVGKYDDLVKLDSPKFQLISKITRHRMERASMDLSSRLQGVRTRLEDFEIPSLWAGLANSSTSDDSKIVDFKSWRASFMATRKHIMSFYKGKYGSWPPKASSKKNDFEESGLNRIVLKEVYQDFADLYDLLVDRTSLTTRSTDLLPPDESSGLDPDETLARALRRLMSEYDHSSPPVQPPMPFDIPLLPSLASTRQSFGSGDSKKEAKQRNKRIKDDEMTKILSHAYNSDAHKPTPFLTAFKNFEHKAAHGRSINELCSQRCGQWIFLYAVLQSLPMVVLDAPGVTSTEGVEYFLCEPAKGGAPWSHSDAGRKKSWYGIAGGTGFVSLPSDVVDFSVEGIYRRSHCWEMAEKWSPRPPEPESATTANAPNRFALASPSSSLSPPGPPPAPPGFPAAWPPAPTSRSALDVGLEALPVPPSRMAPSTPIINTPIPQRPVSSYDPTKKFEDIIGQANMGHGKKK
ncbi:MAG: hypothetical protein M1819_005280 [Sarea resinae]|nr:MAG: hypothetical protein M1819_005280 [Sarea resinae]